ncbi:MAG: WG repeat-containing protein, partial [Fulvivirga sp.]
MRYFLRGLVLILITAVSVAQSKDFQLIYKDGKVGLSDAKGNVVIPAEYEELGWSTGEDEPTSNTIGYRKGEFWGLLALDNQRITEPEYTNLYPAKGGFYIASVRGKISHNDFLGVITNQGKVIIPFKYNAIKLDGLRAVVGVKYGRQYKFGVVDMADKLVIPIEYKDVVSLGHLRFAVKNFDNKTAIFSDAGKPVVDFVLDSISNYQNGHAIIYANHQLGVVNNNGQIVEEPQFQ